MDYKQYNLVVLIISHCAFIINVSCQTLPGVWEDSNPLLLNQSRLNYSGWSSRLVLSAPAADTEAGVHLSEDRFELNFLCRPEIIQHEEPRPSKESHNLDVTLHRREF